MADLDVILKTAIFPSLEILPAKMESTEAGVIMLAIGLQESRFEHRRQIRGPARGYWQFEEGGGVVGVMNHEASSGMAKQVTESLNYSFESGTIHAALEHNDVFAGCFARLLLWTDPRPLPLLADGPDPAWDYYIRNWRPGKPHRSTWDGLWRQACSVWGA